ncbi:MAG: thiamine-phosphate kinase [Deltaproteobacteria bacterium]|nr:thiamine-phosphate kinase [Deltaproteobacteria bacterium]
MELDESGEFGLIARIRKRVPDLPAQVFRGIGDDAAVSSLSPGMDLVSTVDLLIEEVHFDLCWTSPRLLGRKSLSVNVSDLAAMGATPRFALTALALPAKRTGEFLDEFYGGLLEKAAAYQVVLIGGDTSASPERLFIAVTLLGEGKRKALIYRTGARPGDDLYVTGTLGDARLGLLRRQRGEELDSAEGRFLWERHADPIPRLEQGRLLAARGLARAMIDLSDGLYADLGHICRESGVGAVVWAELLPLSPALRALAASPEDSRLLALQGGEDYELLFAAPAARAGEIEELGRQWPCGLTRIGRVEPPSFGLVVRSEGEILDPALFPGYNHFSGRRARPAVRRS